MFSSLVGLSGVPISVETAVTNTSSCFIVFFLFSSSLFFAILSACAIKSDASVASSSAIPSCTASGVTPSRSAFASSACFTKLDTSPASSSAIPTASVFTGGSSALASILLGAAFILFA